MVFSLSFNLSYKDSVSCAIEVLATDSTNDLAIVLPLSLAFLRVLANFPSFFSIASSLGGAWACAFESLATSFTLSIISLPLGSFSFN